MNPWMIPAITSIFGAIQGIQAGKEMESVGQRERLLAEENALLETRELAEQVRRQAESDRQVRSSALARAAASGAVADSGSALASREYLEEQQTRELDWMKTSGASRTRLNLQAGYMRADATKRAGVNQQYSSFFGGVTQAFGFLDKGGMFTKAIPTT
jgi:hypothetical protein